MGCHCQPLFPVKGFRALYRYRRRMDRKDGVDAELEDLQRINHRHRRESHDTGTANSSLPRQEVKPRT